MKRILYFLTLIACLGIVFSSCKKDEIEEPNPKKNHSISTVKYNSDKKEFVITFDDGVDSVVVAQIDDSVNPPTASATLKDGTVFMVDDATIESDVVISTVDAINESRKYVNDWIYKNMSIYYLWNNKLPSSPDYTLTPNKFFESILYTYDANKRPDGDRFSWIQKSYVDLLNNLSGVSSDDIGFEYMPLWADQAKTKIFALVLYPKLKSDASEKGIKRGQFITKIDDQYMTASNYKQLLGGSGTKKLSIAEWQYNSTTEKNELKTAGDVTIQMEKDFAEIPVHLDSVYTIDNKKIGYMVYNFFARDKGNGSHDYDKLLMNTLSRIQSKGATEMVLDLRYNSGGAVSTAIALGSALVKNRSTSNIFARSEYNSLIHKELLGKYGEDYNKEYFIDKITSNSGTIADVPAMNFNRLYILTGEYTASASELIINGLKPYMDEIVLIGQTTYGKNVGSISIYEKNDPKNKWGMQPIIVKYYNSANQSDYTAGFAPNYEVNEFEDLYLVDFGNINDPLLGKAISLITGKQPSASSRTRRVRIGAMRVGSKLHGNTKSFEMEHDIRQDMLRKLTQ